MNKRFTKLIAALALLVFMTPSLTGWGQTSSTKTEGFESATTSTTYNSTYTLDANNSDCGVAWTIYYGCVSTNNKISGNNSAQMRWYSSASSNLPYLQTTTAVDGLTNVAFKAKVGNTNVKMDVNYSENGTDWTALATAVTFENTNVTEFSYEIPSGGKYVKIGVSSSSTAPTSGNYALIVDDVVFSYTSSAITTYNLTYKANGGTGEDYLVEDIENGASHTVLGIEAVGFTAPENKTFVNWKDDNDNEYAVGSEIIVNGNINLYAQWQLSGSYLFYESFDTNNGTGGNDNQWSGTIASSTLQSDNEDWTFANGSGADRCAKFGTGSKLGSAQTPAIAHTGNATLTFKAAAWNGNSENTTLKLSATSGNLSASSVTLTKGAWTSYTIEISNITTSTQIKFEGNSASNSRFFLDEVMVVEAAPSTDPFITAEDVEIAYNVTSGSIMAEIGNYVAGSMMAETEATWITDFTYEDAEEFFEIGFTASENEGASAREAEVVLTFTYGDNQTTTANVTVTQAGNPDAPGTVNNPYTVAQARAAIDAGEGVNGVYATGIVSEIVTAYNSQYGNISYNISADGSTEADQLQAYRGKSYNGENFTSEDDIQVGDIVVVYGDLKNYNGTYEFDAGNQLVSLERPQSTEPSINIDNATIEVAAEGDEGILTVQYENITDIAAEVYFCDAEGTEATYDWIIAEIDADNNVEWLVEPNEGEARTAYFKVWAYDDELSEVYSNLVTVNQAVYVAPASIDLRGVTTPLVFNAGAFTSSGSGYKDYDDVTYIGSNNVQYDGWTLRQVMHSGNNMQMKASSGMVYMPTILTDNGFTITVVAETNSVNVGVGEESEVNVFTTTATSADVVISAGSKYAVISTITITPLQPSEPYTLTINGYTDDNSKTGYYLIASPVTVDPSTVEGMTSDDFDLYQYDDTQDKEWLNWKGDEELDYAGHFNLVPGTGYLYAKKATTETPSYTFNLTGTPYDGNGEINIISGWNLVGNPFAVPAEISMDYYYLTPDATELIATTASTTVAAMQGVFVNNSNGASSVIFMEAETGTNNAGESKLALNLTRNRGNLIDRAIVRFGEGGQLPKFQLNPNNTKLYIAQGNKDYAVVRSAAQGEMPVSFRAAENGTYTLSIETENVEMDYLHLIDNMTGMDVDLLATPNYTFEAKTSDYASRFRLVFSANGIDEQNAETFAYFNGSEWMVSNLGESTLQVVDVMGRVLSTETISGNAELSLNQPAGVYMLRLINGNDVKVQKVVVR